MSDDRPPIGLDGVPGGNGPCDPHSYFRAYPEKKDAWIDGKHYINASHEEYPFSSDAYEASSPVLSEEPMREDKGGKGRFDLISPYGEARLAQRYELGADQYSDRDWEKGYTVSKHIDSLKRHLNSYCMGMRDEDHVAAIAWRAFAIMHIEEKVKLGELPPELEDM